MINKNNIVAFVAFAYKQRRGQDAPAELLQKWRNLSDDEVQLHLQGLFNTWQFTPEQANALKQQFLAQQTVVAAPADKTKVATKPTPPPQATVLKVRGNNKWLGRIAALVVLVPLVYVAVRWFQYQALKPVFAITDNIAVRNEATQQVYRMDLKPPAETRGVASVQSMKALDNEVYERAIDSTGKMKQHRAVILPDVSFTDYLMNHYEKLYVNANLVVDDRAEFNKYSSAFKGLSYEEAYVIELKYRKVIVKCLQMDHSMDDLYITTSCMSTNKAKGLQYFAMQELKKDAVYGVIAKMNDGNYYKFIGDLRANSYTRPVKIGYNAKPTSEDEFLKGDLLFKVQPNKVSLYTCDGKPMNYKSVPDSYNCVSHFEKVEIAPKPQTDNIVDDISELGKSLLDKAASQIAEGMSEMIAPVDTPVN
ncbi:MAG: hypothetical protein RL660_1215 [Bacteroidota bacterium]|jgi:hypothetical protein